MVFVCLLLLLIAGCKTEKRVVSSSWDSLRNVSDPSDSENLAAGEASRAPRGWAIELEQFSGNQRLKQAYSFAAEIRESGQIPDVWFDDQQGVATVYVGRFPRRNSDEAITTLKTVRDAKFNGKRTYRQVDFSPIAGGEGVVSELDLSQHSGYRSLLIEIFDAELGENHRLAAESLAEELREADGDRPAMQSFYYHGPRQSMVTVGLFTLSDFVPINGIDTYGPRIRAMQEFFPLLEQNNKTVPGDNTGRDDGLEPSVIVNVP